jgi:kynurenine 3-monooxygenase
MNAGFEDCSVFNDIMNEEENENAINWKRVFSKYQESRKTNADAIADMAIENFIEMRDLVADEKFLFKKQVQHRLGNTFPGKFMSRYEMVSFSNIPYRIAYELGLKTDMIVDELMKNASSIEEIDMQLAKELIDTHLGDSISKWMA